MALAKGTNSYVDVSEAEAYFEGRIDAAAWVEASVSQKEQSLVTATAMLDDLIWVGNVVSSSQPLAFPRIGSFFDPRLGVHVYLDNNVPLRVVRATFELAYHLLNNDGLLDDVGSVDSISVGGVSLTKIRQASKFPFTVSSLITPVRANGGSQLWWRAN